MCMYERKMRNIKYLPNKKNKGNAPPCEDLRLATITAPCGWCEECRKKIANDWRIRLIEEIKVDKDCTFATLSFSPEWISKIETDIYIKKWRGYETEEGEINCDVNDLAAYAVRMWSERWRKHNKKAPKHFLITELGENKSERIHLHGLIWGDKEMINKTWKYGNVMLGQWVDERTINYIIKYITKIDKIHEGYKQRTFVSKKLGENYIKKNKTLHKFKGENTITYYKTSNGSKLGLPRYYKDKLWTEEEKQQLWLQQLNKEEIKIGKTTYKTKELTEEEIQQKINSVRENNKRAGYGSPMNSGYKYIITEEMKKKGKINDVKSIQKIEKRDIIKTCETEQTKDKSTKVKYKQFGHYINNTTTAQREYNKLFDEANSKGISIRVLRLIKAGIIVDNFVDK